MQQESFMEHAAALLRRVHDAQRENIAAAAACIAASLLDDGILHVFGAGHSHMAAEELYFRAGGLAPVNPILFPPLMQHEGPVSSTRLERLPGLAEILLDQSGARPGEPLLIVSNSGKNAVPVEMALAARARGIQTIGIVSRAHAEAAPPGAGQSRKLHEICGIVIDNGGLPGDAALALPGAAPPRTGPTSSVVNLAILQEIVLRVCHHFIEADREPPLFKSANLPGGDEWNAKLIARYRGRVNLR